MKRLFVAGAMISAVMTVSVGARADRAIDGDGLYDLADALMLGGFGRWTACLPVGVTDDKVDRSARTPSGAWRRCSLSDRARASRSSVSIPDTVIDATARRPARGGRRTGGTVPGAIRCRNRLPLLYGESGAVLPFVKRCGELLTKSP